MLFALVMPVQASVPDEVAIEQVCQADASIDLYVEVEVSVVSVAREVELYALPIGQQVDGTSVEQPPLYPPPNMGGMTFLANNTALSNRYQEWAFTVGRWV